MDVAVVGGGAAGFFAAITVKEHYPSYNVTVFEKNDKVLSKVRLSGGGRCNLTNAVDGIENLVKAYPRGAQFLKKAFYRFDNKAAFHWFESRGAALVVQEDGCVFPRSQNSQTIVNLLLDKAVELGVRICKGAKLTEIFPRDEEHPLTGLLFPEISPDPMYFGKAIITTGGSPRKEGLDKYAAIGLGIEKPVPALYSFNVKEEGLNALSGIVVEGASVAVSGTRFRQSGDLLITHYGLSGPAILKLSSWAARDIAGRKYSFQLSVNWTGSQNYETLPAMLSDFSSKNAAKLIVNAAPCGLQFRLWNYLCVRAGISPQKRWGELSGKLKNRMTEVLLNDKYSVEGRGTYKEEFVTCGGISLKEIDSRTMKCKAFPDLYFAGEILDIDGITGGYNLQAAWTTGYICGLLE